MAGKERERSADSLPHWFFLEFLPKLPVCSIIWFLGSEASPATCQEPAPTAADHEGQSAVTNASRNSRNTSKAENRCNRATEVIYSTTCSAFHSLHFTDGPSHSVVSSSSTVQVQSSPGGWSTYLLEDSPFFFLLFSLLFLLHVHWPAFPFSYGFIYDPTMFRNIMVVALVL